MSTTQLAYKCPDCGKKVSAIGEFSHDSKKFLILDCGHFTSIEITSPISNYESYSSLEGDKPYKFQVEGMEFIQNSNARCLIADEMGLGKTIQALGYLFYNPQCNNVLHIVKKKLTTQFWKQIYRWDDKALAQVVKQGHAILPGINHYIISMDLIRTYPMERFKEVGIKTVVIDECQHFNNPDAARTQALRKFIADNEIPHIIALSGTPFKNRLSEYFTILNILAPHYFNIKEEFIRQHILFYYDMADKIREKGLRNPEYFKRLTSGFILRRERQDVEDQIPYVGIIRNLEYCDLDEKYQKMYDNTEAEYAEIFSRIDDNSNAMKRNTDLLAIIQRMRHIVGLSKIPDVVDFVTDFLLSTERKLAIAVDHQDVGMAVIAHVNKYLRMGGYKDCLAITGNMKDSDLEDVKTKWNTDSSYRILVASTKAAGEGLNLQEMCNECIFAELQWNAANEEQFEARFRRIGQKNRNVTATYAIAGGTIDEMLTEIRERKRWIFKQGMLSKDQLSSHNDSELMTQLGEMITNKRAGKKWSLK